MKTNSLLYLNDITQTMIFVYLQILQTANMEILILDAYNEALYYYMRNFCNFIGLEQWYLSLIWNTYLWKLQTFCW